MQRHHLGGHKVEFDIRYPAEPQQKNNYLTAYSQAAFTLGENASPPADPGASDVGDSIAVWLHAIRSPIAEYVDLNQPTWAGSAQSGDIVVTLKPGATAAEAHGAANRRPKLGGCDMADHDHGRPQLSPPGIHVKTHTAQRSRHGAVEPNHRHRRPTR